MSDWRPIPEEIDTTNPPFNGDDVLIWADSACTNIVRLAWWREDDPDDVEHGCERGWWSYKHSVTQEHLDYLKPTYWMPFDQPAPLLDEVRCEGCGQIYFCTGTHKCTALK